MITASTGSLDLMEGWHASDPERARLRFTFPINRLSGARASSVVYFEVPPGQRLPRHTDSAEEILYIVEGTAEVELGDERGTVRAGDLAVIPGARAARPRQRRRRHRARRRLVRVGGDHVRVRGADGAVRRRRARAGAAARARARLSARRRPPSGMRRPAALALV